MKVFKLNPNNPDMDLINEAINILSIGGVILYPTDTVYGLGANIFDKFAVKRIYNIKKRAHNKPMSISVSNIKDISIISNLSQKQEDLIKNYLPGPYTFILNKKPIVPNFVTPNTYTVGLRIPDSKIARMLSCNFPIITTSANVSNLKTLNNPKDILKQLNVDVDLVLDVGILNNSKPSKIIDLTKINPVIIRD